MIPTTGLDEIESICKKRYGSQNKIVGIMIAQYSVDDVKKIVRESYKHWNHSSGKEFDVFWLGYENTDKLYCDYETVIGVDSLFYYDEIFSHEVRRLQEEKFVDYKDGGCTLLLIKYDGEKLDFSDYILKNLLNMRNDMVIREYMNAVIRFAGYSDSIESLKKQLPHFTSTSTKELLDYVFSFINSIPGWIALFK